jgi:4-carboxymuconolactone decarboxylase
MKRSDWLFIFTVIICLTIAGHGFTRVMAQQYATVGQSLANLPPDIRRDTLSRMPRTERDNLKTNSEREAYDRVIAYSSKQRTATWLGPTGTRLQIPEVAEAYNKQIQYLHANSGISEKYAELAIAVATRETNNQEEFLDHEPERLKLLGPKVEEIIRKNLPPDGLPEDEAVIIQFGRELFRDPAVSSKTFADMQKAFGPKLTLNFTAYMGYYLSNGLLVNRAYDQKLDINAKCSGFDTGCIDPNHPLPW